MSQLFEKDNPFDILGTVDQAKDLFERGYYDSIEVVIHKSMRRFAPGANLHIKTANRNALSRIAVISAYEAVEEKPLDVVPALSSSMARISFPYYDLVDEIPIDVPVETAEDACSFVVSHFYNFYRQFYSIGPDPFELVADIVRFYAWVSAFKKLEMKIRQQRGSSKGSASGKILGQAVSSIWQSMNLVGDEKLYGRMDNYRVQEDNRKDIKEKEQIESITSGEDGEWLDINWRGGGEDVSQDESPRKGDIVSEIAEPRLRWYDPEDTLHGEY